MGHHAARLGVAQLLQRVVGAQMHDVDRRPRDLGDRQRPMRTLRLDPGRPGQRVLLGLDMTFGKRDLDQLVDDDAVLGMHADQRAVLAGLAHGPEDGPSSESKAPG